MKRALRRAIARVAPPASPGGLRVLLYHAVDDPVPDDPLFLRVPRQRFIEQMAWLKGEGYSVVPLAALIDAQTHAAQDDRPQVSITFDDGYRSGAWAADILRSYGFTATFFVTPRFLDGVESPAAYWEQWGHLGWEDAKALIADGFDVGAHSSTHPDLRRCDQARLEDEVSGARAVLEQRLAAPVVAFSYPYGRHDRRVRTAVERAGYHLGCTSRFGLNRTPGRSFAVHRTEVAGTDDIREFAWKVRGKYDWLGYWRDIRHPS